MADDLKAVSDALAKALISVRGMIPAPTAWKAPLDTTSGTDEPSRTVEEGGT